MKLFDDLKHEKIVSDIVSMFDDLGYEGMKEFTRACDLAHARILTGSMKDFNAHRALESLKNLCYGINSHRDTTVRCFVITGEDR